MIRVPIIQQPVEWNVRSVRHCHDVVNWCELCQKRRWKTGQHPIHVKQNPMWYIAEEWRIAFKVFQHLWNARDFSSIFCFTSKKWPTSKTKTPGFWLYSHHGVSAESWRAGDIQGDLGDFSDVAWGFSQPASNGQLKVTLQNKWRLWWWFLWSLGSWEWAKTQEIAMEDVFFCQGCLGNPLDPDSCSLMQVVFFPGNKGKSRG